jgi:signal peptidase I
MLDTPVHSRSGFRIWVKILIVTLAFVAVLAISTGSIFGGIRPYSLPTSSMIPAIQPGDRFLAEGISLRARPPKRGELLLFSTDNIPSLPPGQTLVKRLVGLPGEHLQIKNGQLYINGAQVTLTNSSGPMTHHVAPGVTNQETDVKIPAGHYFFIGDNSTNSNDSRFFGTVPAQNIRARPWFRYSPAASPRVIN